MKRRSVDYSTTQLLLFADPSPHIPLIIDGRSDPTRFARRDPLRFENHELVKQGQKRCRTCKEIKRLEEFGPGYPPKFNIGGVKPHCRLCEAASSRLRFRKRFYGMSYEEYMSLFAAQAGLCAICGKPGESPDTVTRTGKRGASGVLVVDHDHSTGRIRGLLCINCNSAIGHLNDNPDLFVKAREYLLRVL